MSQALLDALRRFYALFWERRDLDASLSFFRADAVMRDHRAMGTWEGTREDWKTVIPSFWSMLPDAKVVNVDVLRQSGDRNVHVVVLGGTDSVTGGHVEVEFFAVAQLDKGLVAALDFFDGEAAALAHFERVD